jgi:hypothetical protein
MLAWLAKAVGLASIVGALLPALLGKIWKAAQVRSARGADCGVLAPVFFVLMGVPRVRVCGTASSGWRWR